MSPSDAPAVLHRFGGVQRLLGIEAYARIAAAHVCVIGIGGVGSWAVESLARSGIGALTLVDLDDVCLSNTNRQLHALSGTVGRPKVEVMAERVRRIHPDCVLHPVADFLTGRTVESLLAPGFDAVLDCIDRAADKCVLLARCYHTGQAVISVGGVGGRRDPAALALRDLNRTARDPLLKAVRKRLRQQYDLPRGSRRWGIPCVASSEPPGAPADGTATGRLDCATGYGTVSYVSGVAGLMAAGAAIERIAAAP